MASYRAWLYLVLVAGGAVAKPDSDLARLVAALQQDWLDDDYGGAPLAEQSDYGRSEEELSPPADKRSAVMAALTSGGRRLRRVPSPHASKGMAPFVEIGGVLDSLGDYMGSLRHSLKNIHEGDRMRHAALVSPSVVMAGNGNQDMQMSSGSGGTRRLYALRPLHPNMHIRSFVSGGGGGEYRGANQHDPGYLWTGLGR